MNSNEKLAEVIRLEWEASRIAFETALRSPLPFIPHSPENTSPENKPMIQENLPLPPIFPARES